MIKYILQLSITAFLLYSCKSSGSECSKFFTYETKTVDIKAISTTLRAEGIPVGVSVGEILIKPQYERASDKLKELDLLQFTLCNQISEMNDADSAKRFARLDYIKTLQAMLQIAQKPDTNLDVKVRDLEKSNSETKKVVDTIKTDLKSKTKDIEKLKKFDDERTEAQKQDSILRSIPPNIFPYLVLADNKTIYLHMRFINKVPTNIDYYVDIFGSNDVLSGILMSRPTIYPKNDEAVTSTNVDIRSWRLSTDTMSKITLKFAYQSIYYAPPNNINKYAVVVDYLVDPVKNSIVELDRRNTIIKPKTGG